MHAQASFLALVVTAALAPTYTWPATPRATAIDVRHLAIDLRFDWQKKRAIGTAAITFAPLQPSTTIALDAGHLAIHSIVDSRGAPVAFTYDGGDGDGGLVVTLDRMAQPPEPQTITVAYHTTWVNESDPNNLWGSTGKGLRFFQPTFTEPIKRRQIWSMGEPEGNRYWFPGHDSPGDLRTTDLRLTVEPPLIAVGNGRLIDTRANADGTRTFHWRADVPHANHLTSFVVGEFVDVPQRFGEVVLHNYGYPDEVDAVTASVERLPDMVRWFSQVTGVRYPFESYAQVFVQDLPWGAGSMASSTLTENMIDDERTHADYLYLWDGLEAEALASQWFGTHLTVADWSHAWLGRGFAHYFDALYDEQRHGRENFLLWKMAGDHGTYLADWAAGTRHPVVTRDPARAAGYAVDNYPAARGALVLHMLRMELGDETWWKVIRHYVATNAGTVVTTDAFVRSVEQVTGQSWGWFFDQWIYRAGHPVFEVTKTWDGARRALTLRVAQTQSPDPKADHPQVAFFAGGVDVAIDDRVLRVRLEAKAVNLFTFEAAAEPRLVAFDRGNTWIKELTFAKPIEELLHQLQHDTDAAGRRWAMNELVALAKKDSTAGSARGRVVAALRRLVLSDVHWRLKYTAILQLTALLAPPSTKEPATLDAATIDMLLTVNRTEKSWVRSVALSLLGTTRDPQYASLYVDALKDPSHPVNYAAAIALGQSRSPIAFDVLTAYMKVPSWKGENILCGLSGLEELGDARGVPVALEALRDTSTRRWTLAIARWDFRIAAAKTLVALGRRDAGLPVVLERFTRSLEEGDVNDIFSNLLLIVTLGDPRGGEAFDVLKARYRDDANAMTAVTAAEQQFQDALKRR